LSRGCNHPIPSGSNSVGGTNHSVASGFHISVGGQPQVGGHNPFYGKIIPVLQYHPWNLTFQGNQQPSGGNILKLILLFLPISVNRTQVL
jgi:hypothetical protein